MGFALWIDSPDSLAWAQGTHEYRPMGSAVIGITDQFRPADFRSRRRCPWRLDRAFVGLFGSLEEVNAYLRKLRKSKRSAPENNHRRAALQKQLCVSSSP